MSGILNRLLCTIALLTTLPAVGAPALAQDIHEAAAAGDLARVLEVLAQQPELVEATDERGFTPLHLAVRSDHREVVDTLLSKGADLETAHERYGLTAVGFAFQSEIRAGTADLTPYLISRGARFDPNESLPRGIRRLDMAVVFGNTAMVRFLLDIGADANAETAYPLSPLVNVASSGHVEIARLLLERGADADVEDVRGNPPVHWAVTRGHGDMLRLLLDHGARVDFVETRSGRNLLHLAALRGHLDAIDPLMARGIDLGVADALGETPLYYAAKYGHALVAARLIDHGAAEPANLEARYGMSPHLTREMDEGEAAAWYLNHRGWAIRTRRHMLVFDAEEWGVTRPTEPSLANGFVTPREMRHLNVVALYTTYHGELGEPGTYIHEIEDSLPNVTYVHDAGHEWRWPGNTVYLSPNEQTTIGEVDVATIEVTTTMTSFGYLVKVDGLDIFYAGFRAESLDAYVQALETLAQHTDGIDMAFLPMAEPDEEESAFEAFVERFNPSAIFVLDPDRREHLFPEMARKVTEWGFDCTAHSAEHPGDVFVYRR